MKSKKMKKTRKNSSEAANEDTSMPRVAVMPINTPSHINANEPAMGISHVQIIYERALAITSVSSVRMLTIGMLAQT